MEEVLAWGWVGEGEGDFGFSWWDAVMSDMCQKLAFVECLGTEGEESDVWWREEVEDTPKDGFKEVEQGG